MPLPSQTDFFNKELYVPLLLNQLASLHSRVDHVKSDLILQSHKRQVLHAQGLSGEVNHKLLTWANIEYKKKNFLESAFHYDGAAKATPPTDKNRLALIYRMLAKCSLNMSGAINNLDFSVHFSDPVEAMNYLKVSATLNPSDCRYLFYMAKVAFALDKFPEAIFYLKRFLQSLPEKSDWSQNARVKTRKFLIKIQSITYGADTAAPVHRIPQDRLESLRASTWLHPSLKPEAVPMKGNGIISSEKIPAGSHVFIAPDAYALFERQSDVNSQRGADVTLDFMVKFIYGLLQTILRNPNKMQNCLLLDSTSHWEGVETQRCPMSTTVEEDESVGPEYSAYILEQIKESENYKAISLPTEYVNLYVRLYRIVSTNAHGVPPGGNALFPLASRVNHSCCASILNPVSLFSRPIYKTSGWPSINPYLGGGVKMIGSAQCTINPKEEITIQYVSMSLTWNVDERRRLISETWKFECSCPICLLQSHLKNAPAPENFLISLEKLDDHSKLLIENCKSVVTCIPNAETEKCWLDLENNIAQKLLCLSLDCLRDMNFEDMLNFATNLQDYQHLEAIFKKCPPTSARCVVFMIQAALVPSLQLLASHITEEIDRTRSKNSKESTESTIKSMKRELRVHCLTYVLAWSDLNTDLPINCDSIPYSETIGSPVESLAESSSNIRKCLVGLNELLPAQLYTDVLGKWRERELYYADILYPGDELAVAGST